ncbi:MAG: hypothetical protein ABW321_31685 [Polyangiales bacterium]
MVVAQRGPRVGLRPLPRHAWSHLALMAALSLLCACTVQIPDGRLRCQGAGDCPASWFCHTDQRCHSQVEVAPHSPPPLENGDAAAADAAAADAASADAAAADAGTATAPDAAPPGDAGSERDAAPPPDAEADATPPAAGDSEDCFDDVDNDLDGDLDCADADCRAPAQCVPAPDAFALGVVVDVTTRCPAGTRETKLYRGLSGGTQCSGCGCTPKPVRCEADLFIYNTLDDCNADVNNVGGRLATRVSLPCGDIKEPIETGSGFRAGVIEVVETCNSEGTAAADPATWQETTKFCAFAAQGGGCAEAERCVPRPTEGPPCALSSGSAACEGYESVSRNWYTGYDDTRSCAGCTCKASGGACDYAVVEIGSDWGCTGGDVDDLSSSTKSCKYSYSPLVGIRASRRESTCTASAALSGSLTPKGQQTLCCAGAP